MRNQRIADIMTTMPVQVDPTASVTEVAMLMREMDIGTVLVTDGGKVTGLVTDRDLVVRVMADRLDPTTEIGVACTAHPLCLSPEDDVDSAMDTMRARAIRRLPVVQDGQAVGIVSLGDLAELRDPGSVLGAISAAESNSY